VEEVTSSWKTLAWVLRLEGKLNRRSTRTKKRANIYDEDAPERVWIHIVSTDLWESITGVVTPMTPIVPGTYKEYNYPWFDLYDEHLPALQPTGRFANLQSVRQLDTSASPSSNLPDPTNPPRCSTHPQSKSGCTFRPCGHYGCEGCVGRVILGGNKCPVCRQAVARMVGFQKPIPRVNVGGGSEGDWWSVEEKIEGIPAHDDSESEAASVVTLVLDEDNVSCLSGTTL